MSRGGVPPRAGRPVPDPPSLLQAGWIELTTVIGGPGLALVRGPEPRSIVLTSGTAAHGPGHPPGLVALPHHLTPGAAAELSTALALAVASGCLTAGDRTADLANVRALYHRRPSVYAAQGEEQAARFAAQENRRGLGGILGALPGCLYLSHPQSIARAEYKPAQLGAAIRVGLNVPDTLITNDPAEARAFTAGQPTIYKPLHAGAYDIAAQPAGIWAAPVEPGEIDDSVRACAHLFQAQVPKTSDVRAVVVGEQAFCARITGPAGVLDWRAAYEHLTYEQIACPDEVRGSLLRFLTGFGLAFGAFDFALTTEDEWWFLECNPNGQWAWLDHAAGLPLTTTIADLLQFGENA